MRSAWCTRADVERTMGAGTMTDAESMAAHRLLLLRGQSASPVA